MKKLLILLFSILISFNSYGEWEKIYSNDNGASFFIDLDSIKENNEYVYFWQLHDQTNPSDTNMMSSKIYKQGDCGVNRVKILSFTYYNQPMGGGSGKSGITPDKWDYPSPGTLGKYILNYVCEYVY